MISDKDNALGDTFHQESITKDQAKCGCCRVQQFIDFMATMGFLQIISCLLHESKYTLEEIFMSEQLNVDKNMEKVA